MNFKKLANSWVHVSAYRENDDETGKIIMWLVRIDARCGVIGYDPEPIEFASRHEAEKMAISLRTGLAAFAGHVAEDAISAHFKTSRSRGRDTYKDRRLVA